MISDKEYRLTSISVVVFIVISILIIVTFVGKAFAVAGALLWLNPANASVNPGDSIQIVIQLDEISDVYGLEISLSFDPSVLEVIDADPGEEGVQIAEGSCPYPDFVQANTADNSTGTLDYVISQLNPREPCNGGVVGTIEFQCVATGVSSDVTFTTSIISDSDFFPIDHSTENSNIVCNSQSTEKIFLPLLMK